MPMVARPFLELHDEFYGTGQGFEIIDDMDSLRRKVRQSVSTPLTDAVTSCRHFLVDDLYPTAIHHLDNTLAPYFDDTIKDVVRDFKVWMKPIARFDSPDGILHYQLSEEQGQDQD